MLIFTAVMMALATGYLAFFIERSYTATGEDLENINLIKRDFQGTVDPKIIINFNSLFYSSNQTQLIDPVYLNAEPGTNPRIRYSTSNDCFQDSAIILNLPFSEKTLIWEQFRCGRRSELPKGFFTESPFIHPSGSSFAFLAFQTKKSPFATKTWVERHLPFFHILEFKHLKKEFGELGQVFEFLSDLDRAALRGIANGQGTVLTENFLLAKISYPSLFSMLEYRFYDRRDLEAFLDQTPYYLHSYQRGRPCFLRDGPLCWNYNIRHIFELANKSTLAFFGGLIFIVLLIIRLILHKLKAEREEDQRRRLALQVLGHEFRTPVTSLLLQAENLNKNFEKIPHELQDSFLRMTSEIYRLQRLTETSRNYLRAKPEKKLIHLNFEKIESVAHWMDEFVYPFIDEHGPEQMIVEPPENDFSFEIDQYWLSTCLKNLVSNAFYHGEAPVHLKWDLRGERFHIEVKDQGESQFAEIKDMTSEFVKGNKSSGTGLGLNIVYKVVREMGGQLDYYPHPTRFMITLKSPKKDRAKEGKA